PEVRYHIGGAMCANFGFGALVNQFSFATNAQAVAASGALVRRNGNPQSTCRFRRQTAWLRPPTSQDTACVLIWPGCRGASDAYPVQRLFAFDLLEPFEQWFHLVALQMPRQQQELLLELRLVERTLRRPLETSYLP